MVLCIAIGNPLRGDDGVARRALRLLPADEHIRALEAIQLTPELAPEIAAANAVIFLDADASLSEVVFETVAGCSTRRTPLSHSTSTFEVLEIARRLFGFAGEAWLCRIPAQQFEAGEGLTPQAEEAARSVAKLVESIYQPIVSTPASCCPPS